MASQADVRRIALSLPGTEEAAPAVNARELRPLIVEAWRCRDAKELGDRADRPDRGAPTFPHPIAEPRRGHDRRPCLWRDRAVRRGRCEPGRGMARFGCDAASGWRRARWHHERMSIEQRTWAPSQARIG